MRDNTFLPRCFAIRLIGQLWVNSNVLASSCWVQEIYVYLGSAVFKHCQCCEKLYANLKRSVNTREASIRWKLASIHESSCQNIKISSLSRPFDRKIVKHSLSMRSTIKFLIPVSSKNLEARALSCTIDNMFRRSQRRRDEVIRRSPALKQDLRMSFLRFIWPSSIRP